MPFINKINKLVWKLVWSDTCTVLVKHDGAVNNQGPRRNESTRMCPGSLLTGSEKKKKNSRRALSHI